MVCIIGLWNGTHLHRNRDGDCCDAVATELRFKPDFGVFFQVCRKTLQYLVFLIVILVPVLILLSHFSDVLTARECTANSQCLCSKAQGKRIYISTLA